MRLGFATLLLVLLAACGGQSRVDTPLLVEWRGATAATSVPQQHVATNDLQWQELWALAGQPAPQPLRPGTVGVGVFLGQKPTAGYGIDMQWSRAADGSLQVRWGEIAPSAGSFAGQMITQPWRIAMLKADGKPVNLAEGIVREVEDENRVIENEVQDEIQREGPDAVPGASGPLVDDRPSPPAPPAAAQEIQEDLQDMEDIEEGKDPGEAWDNDMPAGDENLDEE